MDIGLNNFFDVYNLSLALVHVHVHAHMYIQLCIMNNMYMYMYILYITLLCFSPFAIYHWLDRTGSTSQIFHYFCIVPQLRPTSHSRFINPIKLICKLSYESDENNYLYSTKISENTVVTQ